LRCLKPRGGPRC